MTQFNQALIAAASSIALFGGAMTLITPAAKADTLYSDPFSYDTFGGRQTFNNGDYTRLDNNDFNSSPIYEDHPDRNGNLYDCDWIGSCRAR